MIGGTAAGAGNVVAGNVSANILIEPYATTVQGNRIGTNAAGTAAVLASTIYGVLVKAPGSVIGGTTAAARNVISGHTYGLVLSGSLKVDVTNVTAQGNYIGTDVTGTTAIPNGHGVFVDKAGFTVGGTAAGARISSLETATGSTWRRPTWGPITSLALHGNWIGLNAAGGRAGQHVARRARRCAA